MTRRKRRIKILIMALATLTLAAAFTLPPIIEKTESSEFCASCHVMEPQYESWIHSGNHAQLRCVDCHLPNDSFIAHYGWKALDGLKDAYAFYIYGVADPIEASPHAKKVIQSNCTRCHQDMITMMNTEGMNCWHCHRNATHHFAPVISTAAGQ